MRLLQWFWLAIAAVVLFNLGVLAQLILSPTIVLSSSEITVHTGNALGWSLGALLCARVVPEVHARSSVNSLSVYRRLPLWISLAYLANGVAEAVSSFYHWQHITQVPMWVQGLFLLQYPCLLRAVWSLPGSPSSRSRQLRVLLDSLLLMTTIVAWSWYVLLGPEILNGNFSPLAKMMDLIYASADLLLFICMFRLFSQLHSSLLRPVRRLLLIGFIAIIPAASIDLLSHIQLVPTQIWITVSESVGYCFIAIAVQILRFPEREALGGEPTSTDDAVASPWWQILLPYTLVPTVLLLMLWLWFTDRQSMLAQGVFLAGLMIMVQILVRQVMFLREVLVTNRHLRSTHEALQMKQQTLSEVNEQLGEANKRLELQANELAVAYERQIQINELKDQFMLHVSHELRTPLTTLHGYLSLLHEQQDSLDLPLQSVFIANALDGSEELQDLIVNVQDALESEAQMRPPQWESFLLAPLIRETLETFDSETKEGYKIELLISDLFIVQADRKLLQQILHNLLSNAFKYCSSHTLIQVGACVIAPETEQGEQVHIWVQDAGPGIPPSEIPLLFGKFIRLKRDMTGSIRGMGLGLYICKRLIEAMEGRIWIESSGIAGEGSRVCVMLPTTHRI
jgi:signal transduction histidine kinase